jgi:uncharacterized phage-associated protein
MIDSNIKIPNSKKILAFRYIIYKLHENGFENIWIRDGSISKLIAQKLLFAVCLASNNNDNTNESLFQLFDKFYALKSGHVESDVLNDINENISCYQKENILNQSNKLDNQSEETKIDFAILELLTQKPQIKNYSTYELVEFSHSYKSWINAYSGALYKGKMVEKISTDELMSERLK